MINIQRTTIVGMRHAQPMKDPETKRSLDCITEQGALDAIELGKEFNGYVGNVYLCHSGMIRALQTAANINVGMGRTVQGFSPMEKALGLAAFKAEGRTIPKGISYGPDFINLLLEQNPGVAEEVSEEIRAFIQAAYIQSTTAENGQDGLVIGVSHGPKVEIGYGMLMGVPENRIGEFAANPLDGFEIFVDTYRKSGNIDKCMIGYKDDIFKKLSPGLFVTR